MRAVGGTRGGKPEGRGHTREYADHVPVDHRRALPERDARHCASRVRPAAWGVRSLSQLAFRMELGQGKVNVTQSDLHAINALELGRGFRHIALEVAHHSLGAR